MVDRDAVVHADSLVELQDFWRLVDRLGLVDVAEGPAVAHEFKASREAEVAAEADPVHFVALGAVLLERRPRDQDAVVAVVIAEVLMRVDVALPRFAAAGRVDRPRSRSPDRHGHPSRGGSTSRRRPLQWIGGQLVGDVQAMGGDLVEQAPEDDRGNLTLRGAEAPSLWAACDDRPQAGRPSVPGPRR